MKAVLYSVTISDSLLDHIHGFHHNIKEIYIPTYKLFFNYQGIWKMYKGRYKEVKKIRTIEIDDMIARDLSFSLDKRLEAEEMTKQILEKQSKEEQEKKRRKKK